MNNKYQSYHYIDGDVELKFSFKDRPEACEEKIKFIKLLKQATNDLELEIQTK